MNFYKVKQLILSMLKKDLSKNLHYHSYYHTIDVMESVERLAQLERIDRHNTILLKTAALFHDMGFLEVYTGHEDISINYAKKILPDFGYSKNDIETICLCIKATRIPQKPEIELAKTLCDADLDYFGRDDFYYIAHGLKMEWEMRGHHYSLKEWYIQQLAFLKNHKYFTKSAIELREEKKQLRIKEMEELLQC